MMSRVSGRLIARAVVQASRHKKIRGRGKISLVQLTKKRPTCVAAIVGRFWWLEAEMESELLRPWNVL